MKNPTNWSSVLAGIITACGVYLSELVTLLVGKSFMNSKHYVNIGFGIFFFILPMLILVIGIPFMRQAIIRRFTKPFGIKLYFPSDKDELAVLLRGIIWFVTCASVLLIGTFLRSLNKA